MIDVLLEASFIVVPFACLLLLGFGLTDLALRLWGK